MKHLTIRVRTSENGERYGKVEEQTKTCENFGRAADDGSMPGCDFLHEEFLLRSSHGPSTMIHRDGLYVRGDRKEEDHAHFEIPSEDWHKKLTAAVRAYNKHFSGK